MRITKHSTGFDLETTGGNIVHVKTCRPLGAPDPSLACYSFNLSDETLSRLISALSIVRQVEATGAAARRDRSEIAWIVGSEYGYNAFDTDEAADEQRARDAFNEDVKADAADADPQEWPTLLIRYDRRTGAFQVVDAYPGQP